MPGSAPNSFGVAPRPVLLTSWVGSSGTLTCHFDDATELMAWHRAFVMCFGWAPMDIEIRVTASEAGF